MNASGHLYKHPSAAAQPANPTGRQLASKQGAASGSARQVAGAARQDGAVNAAQRGAVAARQAVLARQAASRQARIRQRTQRGHSAAPDLDENETLLQVLRWHDTVSSTVVLHAGLGMHLAGTYCTRMWTA